MLNCLKVSNFGLDSGNFVSNLQGNFLKFFLISDNETDALNNNAECGKDMSFGPMTLTSSSTLVVEFVSKSSRFMAKSKQGFRLLFLSASDMCMGIRQQHLIFLFNCRMDLRVI